MEYHKDEKLRGERPSALMKQTAQRGHACLPCPPGSPHLPRRTFTGRGLQSRYCLTGGEMSRQEATFRGNNSQRAQIRCVEAPVQLGVVQQ